MSLFQSFIIGGYECADQINKFGHRVNLLQETAHNSRVRQDYEDLAAIGIKTAREGICWSAVERVEYVYDFSEVKNRMDAAAEQGIQQIWDLVHFGYPDGIYPTHPLFVDRFVSLCEAFVEFYQTQSDQTLLVVPINEISFLSWLSGDVAGTVPFVTKNGWEIKYQLCKAAIAGIRAIKKTGMDCRIFMIEPVIKIHTDYISDDHEIEELNETQFQALDIILGRICPELGGAENLVDFVGVNYYWDCQWQHNYGPLPWPSATRTPLSEMLDMVYRRYDKPLLLSETGNFGEKRIPWLKEITADCRQAMEMGVDLQAICLYPIVDRPDWDFLENYSQCGVWDLDVYKNRIPEQSYISAIMDCQSELKTSEANRQETKFITYTFQKLT